MGIHTCNFSSAQELQCRDYPRPPICAELQKYCRAPFPAYQLTPLLNLACAKTCRLCKGNTFPCTDFGRPGDPKFCYPFRKNNKLCAGPTYYAQAGQLLCRRSCRLCSKQGKPRKPARRT